jgi:hypothetical protein
MVNNSTLTSHYNTLRPYTDETNNISASQVGSVFNNLLYSELAVSGANIQTLLGPSGSLSLDIQFIDTAASGDIPYITIGGTQYPLRRNWTVRGYSPPSGAPSAFTPLPTGTGYNFTRSEELCDWNKSNSNWDISTKTGTSWSSGTGQYAYVSLYIAARGMDTNFNSIYSRPTFLGILRLPD